MIHIRLNKSLHSAQGPMALDVDFRLDQGEFLAVTGPSGSGKTTLLRLLAGLVNPESGLIRYGEELWLDTSQKHCLSPQRRRVGMVFQDYALFPNMTVRENMEYPLERKQTKDIVNELIEIMEIEELIDRRPVNLSGGQQQRVALARALVRRPNLLLLDEPLSALDIQMRAKLQDYVLRAHEQYNLTTLLVSHSREEIRKMSDRVIRLENGRITQSGSPEEILGSPVRLKGKVIGLEFQNGVQIAKIETGDHNLELIVDEADLPGLLPGR